MSNALMYARYKWFAFQDIFFLQITGRRIYYITPSMD